MIKELINNDPTSSQEFSNILADVFIAEILSPECGFGEYIVSLVPKILGTHILSQHRPIAVLHFLYKLLSKIMITLSGLQYKIQGPQFAFRCQHQTHEPVYIMRSLIEKSVEWQLSLWVLDGDITAAFDNVRHRRLCFSMQKRGTPAVLTRAWMKYIRSMPVRFKLDKSTISQPIKRTKSIFQGGSEAPPQFNIVLDDCTCEFLELCSRHGWGFELSKVPGDVIAIVAFADNFWLFASNPSMLQDMLSCWLDCLGRYGFSVPIEECTYCSVVPDNIPSKVVVRGIEVPRSPREIGFKALGCLISFTNHFHSEIEHRISRMWRSFFKYEHIFCNPKVPLRKRMHLVGQLAQQSLLWWLLTKKEESRINAVQLEIYRKMTFPRKNDAEGIDEFMHRTNGYIARCRRKFAIQPWVSHYYRAVYKWAGHLARLVQYDPQRLTYRVFSWKDFQWLKGVMAANGGRQIHGRYLRTWRWERACYKQYKKSQDWRTDALDKRKWEEMLSSMVTWRESHS